jgi:hypothetical protein
LRPDCFDDLPDFLDLPELLPELLRAAREAAFEVRRAAPPAALEVLRAALVAVFEARRAAPAVVFEARRAALRVVFAVAPTASFATSAPARASLLFSRAADFAVLFVCRPGRIISPAVGLTLATAEAVVSRAATPASAACSPACPTSLAALSITSLTTLRAVSSAPPRLSFFAMSTLLRNF